MSASNRPPDPKKLPVPFKGNTVRDDHQAIEWASGTRGAGKVPETFEWQTNPKQHQEERGAGDADTVISK